MEPLKFSNEKKLRRQMRKRGWTEDQIHQAMATAPIPAKGKQGPAHRFQHPATGKSLLVDLATGEIFHLGAKGYRYD